MNPDPCPNYAAGVRCDCDSCRDQLLEAILDRMEESGTSSGLAVADHLRTVAGNGGESATVAHLRGEAEALIEHASRFLEQTADEPALKLQWKAAGRESTFFTGALDLPRAAVIVEVKGGVAELTSCPPGVEVEIIDHD